MTSAAMAAEDPGSPDMDLAQKVAVGLNDVILAGGNFRNHRARELHLGPSDIIALGYLHTNGATLPRELSARMEMTSGTMTALLDRVEKAGFLRRENNPDDRRSLLIQLTPAGEHAMRWLDEQFDAAVRYAISLLPASAVEELPSALNLLRDALAMDGHGPDPAVPGQKP